MKQIQSSIMGHPYTLACREGEEAALLKAVAYLDQKMCAIRDAGKIKGTDRIAVIAALGIAAELLSTKQPEGPFAGMTMAELHDTLECMHLVLDDALTPQENLF
jgi:cell division protein ZapA